MLGIAQRAEVEREARRYADALGYMVDWESVVAARRRDAGQRHRPDRAARRRLETGAARGAPTSPMRADLLVQFMQFQRMAPGGADGPETMQ